MTFTDISYILLLVLTLALYYALPQRARVLMLLAVSYAFYACWHWWYPLLLLFSTVFNYVAALAIDAGSGRRARRAWLIAAICANIGMLAFFKYTGFALHNLHELFQRLGITFVDPASLRIVLPVGMSFYTFQTLSYTIDVYRGRIPAERRFDIVACFVAFFPQLVAGPITRANKLMPQFKVQQPLEWSNLRLGTQLILWGLLKKCVVGDRLREFGYEVGLSPYGYSPIAVLTSMAMLSMWIYLDFSSYTEIARGSARLFGIDLMENFRQPYMARSMTELWTRWHISLTTWIHDYVFRPLLRALPRTEWSAALATFITMILVGAWHGAQSTYLIWGAVNGLVLALMQWSRRRFRTQSQRLGGRMPHLPVFFQVALTQFLWIFMGILFGAPRLQDSLAVYKCLFIPAQPWLHRGSLFFSAAWLPLLAACYLIMYLRQRYNLGERLNTWPAPVRAVVYVGAFYLLWFGSVSGGQDYAYLKF